MRAYMETHAIPGPWPASISWSALAPARCSERLIRSARRLAGQLNAGWTALYVETPDRSAWQTSSRTEVVRTLHLAEELGGRALTLAGRSVAETVVGYARQHNVTKIVVGKPLEPRGASSCADRL